MDQTLFILPRIININVILPRIKYDVSIPLSVTILYHVPTVFSIPETNELLVMLCVRLECIYEFSVNQRVFL